MQSATQSGDHPIMTLLQIRNVLASRARDMLQAVCHITNNPKDFCFHVAQIWYLMIEDSILITCSRQSMSDLQKPCITTKPWRTSAMAKSPATCRIIVSYCDIIWAFPTADCKTWLSFLMHFEEFWPRQLFFFSEGQPVVSHQWSRLVADSQRLNPDIHLHLTVDSDIKGSYGRPDSSTSDSGSDPDDGTDIDTSREAHEAPGRV